MDGTAVTAIKALAQEAAGTLVEIDGVEYSTTPLHDVRKQDPEPKPLVVHTLTGLLGYLKADIDKIVSDSTLIHVDGPGLVTVVGRLRGHFEQRFQYARAEAHPRMEGFAFGQWLSLERMNIALQALFEASPDRERALRLVGTVKDEMVKTSADDGVTQAVTVKSGVAVVAEATVPNPVELAPFRTFPEVPQPLSPFILRLKASDNGIAAALFEADGGAWRNAAVQAIRDYLESAGLGVQVIA